MTRIRTIKPDAFTSESLSSVSVLARWTFAGMWTYLDDDGLGRAEVRLIKAALFPLDDTTDAGDIDGAIGELIEVGCIHTYMSGGKVYMHCPQFRRHQRINRPTASVLPRCSCLIDVPNGGYPQGLSEDSVSDHPHVSWEGREGEGKGKGKGGRQSVSAPTTTPKTRPPRRCQKHLKDNDPPACGKCADARKLADAWEPPGLVTKTPKCVQHPDQPAGRCPKCIAEAVPRPKQAS